MSYASSECDARLFRADMVDAVVRNWIKSLLADPKVLAANLGVYQLARQKPHALLNERLEVLEEINDEYMRQLERMLALYVSGVLMKDMLINKKERLEKTYEL